jgi:hypothetical protein
VTEPFELSTAGLQKHNALAVDEFRSNGGNVGGRVDAVGLLVQTTTVAKSGQSRLLPLAYFDEDAKLSPRVKSFGGAARDPGWAHSRRTHPQAAQKMGSEAYGADALERSSADRNARSYNSLGRLWDEPPWSYEIAEDATTRCRLKGLTVGHSATKGPKCTSPPSFLTCSWRAHSSARAP